MDPPRPPNMNPLLHWGHEGIIRGFHFLDCLGGLGSLLSYFDWTASCEAQVILPLALGDGSAAAQVAATLQRSSLKGSFREQVCYGLTCSSRRTPKWLASDFLGGKLVMAITIGGSERSGRLLHTWVFP